MRIKRWLVARRLIQGFSVLLFLLPLLFSGWLLLGLTVATDEAKATPFNGIFYGSLSSSTLGDLTFLDPFALLQIVAATRTFELEWLLFTLPVLVIYGLIGARVFCGWICPTNFLLEGVDAIRKKLGLKVSERVLPRKAKIGMFVGVIVLSFAIGVPLFEAISPISTINKGLILGSIAGLITLVLIIVLELFWGHRVWCRSLCPLGGFYQLIGRLGIAQVHIKNKDCTQCGQCKEVCLVDPEILDPSISGNDDRVRAGDCMRCGACIDVCPTKALSMKTRFSNVKKSVL